MQVVLRVERRDPPSAAAACEAAALAVVAVLADPRAEPDGAWHAAVTRWETRAIRKVVRRARGAAWEAAAAVPGVTVAHAGAEAHACVPTPVDEVPPAIAKLQVSGTNLEGDLPAALPPGWSGLHVLVRPELELSTGKLAAQAGHAAHRAWRTAPPERRAAWDAAGRPLRLTRPSSAVWREVTSGPAVVITDAGHTEVAPGTITTAAVWVPGAAVPPLPRRSWWARLLGRAGRPAGDASLARGPSTSGQGGG